MHWKLKCTLFGPAVSTFPTLTRKKYSLQQPRLKVSGESIQGEVVPDGTLIPCHPLRELLIIGSPHSQLMDSWEEGFPSRAGRWGFPPGRERRRWSPTRRRDPSLPQRGRRRVLIPLTFHQQHRLYDLTRAAAFSARQLEQYLKKRSHGFSPVGGSDWLSLPLSRCLVFFLENWLMGRLWDTLSPFQPVSSSSFLCESALFPFSILLGSII